MHIITGYIYIFGMDIRLKNPKEYPWRSSYLWSSSHRPQSKARLSQFISCYTSKSAVKILLCHPNQTQCIYVKQHNYCRLSVQYDECYMRSQKYRVHFLILRWKPSSLTQRYNLHTLLLMHFLSAKELFFLPSHSYIPTVKVQRPTNSKGWV